MRNRIVDIETAGTALSVNRGFLVVSRDNEEFGRVAVDDIAAVIVHAHGATVSTSLVSRLAERGIPLVLCDQSHSPVGYLLPQRGHHQQGFRMEAQAAASKPVKKRLWRDLVKAKINAQAEVLEYAGENTNVLCTLMKRVQSGDPDNIEAQAARHYWSKLFGRQFRRDREASDANALLNYGYTVLRAATSRSIVAAGLSPSLSIKHMSSGDPLRLADDLMEPFRPYVDLVVLRQIRKGKSGLDSEAKSELVEVLSMDLHGPFGASPVLTAINRLSTSVASIFCKERKSLELPSGLIALSAAP